MLRFIQYIKNKFIKRYKKCYVIHSNSYGEFYVCRVLNMYDNRNKAINDLSLLVTNNVNEKYLLSEFNKRKRL